MGDVPCAVTLGPIKPIKPTFVLKRTVVMIRGSTKPVFSTASAPKLAGWIDDRDTRRAMNVIINDPHGFDIFTDGHW